MTAHVFSATINGFEGCLIEVECDSAAGLPSLQIVGLGNKAIDEAKERVRSAIKNSGLEFPARRVIVNLAPANLPKDGVHFDIPIALAILCVSDQLKSSQLEGTLFAGELALDGSIRSIRGALQISEAASKNGFKQIVLPSKSASQAALIDGVNIYSPKNLRELYLWLKGEQKFSPEPLLDYIDANSTTNSNLLIDSIYGQEQAKRALAIAAAGHHNILFDGPPGAGKTMLAKALVDLLPPMSRQEIIEVTKLHSVAGEIIGPVFKRPFRAPHHTSSYISLVGGGVHPKPGEISLAHHGVLFLDELPEYPRASLESLRQPLEDRIISVARASQHITYPANFMLVATQNPCPCGYAGDPVKECRCSIQQILSYQKRVSGPLLDRIDMIVPVTRVDHDKLLASNTSRPPSSVVNRQSIAEARQIQRNRFKKSTRKTNAEMTNQDIKSLACLEEKSKSLLNKASSNLQLSARVYFKIIKVARSIADLSGEESIKPNHIAEALSYRLKT